MSKAGVQPSVALVGQLGLMWHAAALKSSVSEAAEKKAAQQRALNTFKRAMIEMMKAAEPEW